MSVTSGLGGLPKRRRCQHAPAPPRLRCDGRSLTCTEKRGNAAPTSAAPVTCFGGNNLITEGVSAVITCKSNLHINVP